MSCDRSLVPFAWSPAIELVQSPPLVRVRVRPPPTPDDASLPALLLRATARDTDKMGFLSMVCTVESSHHLKLRVQQIMFVRPTRQATARCPHEAGQALVHRNEMNEQQRPGALVLFPRS